MFELTGLSLNVLFPYNGDLDNLKPLAASENLVLASQPLFFDIIYEAGT